MTRRLFLPLAAAVCAATSLYGQQTKPLSVRMAESEMKRNPSATMIDVKPGVLKWNYTSGLELLAIGDVAERYGREDMFDYALHYFDTIIDPEGRIYGYRKEKYNVDHVCPGRFLFRAYDRTGDKRYRRAIEILYDQLADQPRTSEGCFWHKEVYPHQVWLDGLYMAQPFYAEYARRFGKKKTGDVRTRIYDDIVGQFETAGNHTFDSVTGLFRHAWDESREMFWADSITGRSAHAWGRAMGWYAMAAVEVLDYLPEKHEGRRKLLRLLEHMYMVLPLYADPESGMWYQVLDCPGREGNYLEATASSMFVYAFLKCVRKGYFPAERKAAVLDLYERLVKRFVREEPDGSISLTSCCSVAGLGGKTMRSGTFDYYISEPVIDNDTKGVGPFIWASLEYEALKNIDCAPDLGERALAFPGAEGGGRFATGGRGGRVLTVTSLGDDGSEGTLRWALEQKFPRIVVFAVAGNIDLERPLKIGHGDLTVAGQTAPGEGICVRNHGVEIAADNVVVRYVRFRMGDSARDQADALEGQGRRNIIVDHCSMSWSTDECASFYANRDFTMQWCILSESLNRSVHSKGRHGYGAIWGGRNATFHHNLLAHHASRNPRLDHPAIYEDDQLRMNRGSVEIVNNVIFNWGFKPIYGGEEGWWNVVGNYFIPGLGTTAKHDKFIEISVNDDTGNSVGSYWISGNVIEGAERVNDDNWRGVSIKGGFARADVDHGEPFVLASGNFEAEPAAEALRRVLAEAGASKCRDAVDRRIVGEVKSGKAAFRGSVSGEAGHIDSQQDVGGWPELKGGKPQRDSDGDGMPDKWERRHGLDPRDPADGAARTLDGTYTNVEVYLNSLAG